MIISHRYRFIFIKTRKTAGTSIEIFLSALCAPDDIVTPITEPGHRSRNHAGLFDPLPEIRDGYPVIGTVRDLLVRRRFYNHIPGGRIRARVLRPVWADYFKFCVERNPWDKTLSHYAFVTRQDGGRPMTFDEYLAGDDLCVNLPAYTEPRDDGRLIVDEVLRYEALDDKLEKTFAMLGVPFRKPLSVTAKGSYRGDRRPYREVFSAAQRDRVQSAFRREIELHGYTFDGADPPHA